MKRCLYAFAAMAVSVAAPAMAADVGVSVQVGEPGFYGRIDIGNFPQPQVINPRPVVIHQMPVGTVVQPIYLRVPPGHAKHWSKHCRKYNACGQPVYFVQDNWYHNEYAPRYRERHGEGRGERHSDGRGNEREHGRGKGKGHRDD